MGEEGEIWSQEIHEHFESYLVEEGATWANHCLAGAALTLQYLIDGDDDEEEEEGGERKGKGFHWIQD